MIELDHKATAAEVFHSKSSRMSEVCIFLLQKGPLNLDMFPLPMNVFQIEKKYFYLSELWTEFKFPPWTIKPSAGLLGLAIPDK